MNWFELDVSYDSYNKELRELKRIVLGDAFEEKLRLNSYAEKIEGGIIEGKGLEGAKAVP